MAFGMGKNALAFKNYLFCRSIYGAMKRYSEKLALKLGKKFNKEIYILRLGEAHGELQNVSREILTHLQDKPTLVPNEPSYTVFPFTIAEALVNISKGNEKPGRYTLVSSPEWNWEEVHTYYCNKLFIKPQIITKKLQREPLIKALKNNLWKRVSEILAKFSAVLESYIFIYFPKIEKKIMAKYYIQRAKNQISEYNDMSLYSPYNDRHHGKILGKRLNSLSDTRTTIEEISLPIKKLLTNIDKNLNSCKS